MPLYIRIFQIAMLLTTAFLSGLVLAEPKNAGVQLGELHYSFIQTPYIHPKIIQDLITWQSDNGDQVIAINLSDSQESNRYFGEIQVRDTQKPYPFIYIEDSNKGFGYQYIGETKTGLHILYTSEWDGGSGVFKRLILLTFKYDDAIQVDWKKSVIHSGKKRVLLWKSGEIGLGDRWEGELKVKDNKLFIGKDHGWFTSSGGEGGGWLSYDRKDRTLWIEMNR